MRYRKRKQKLQKRKDYIQKITNRAFAAARGVCKNFIWEPGMKCYHQDYVNCLLQYNELVNENDSRVLILTAPDNMKLNAGREVRVKTRELITLTELQLQMSKILDEDKYGEDYLQGLIEQLNLDMKNQTLEQGLNSQFKLSTLTNNNNNDMIQREGV